MKNNSRFKNFLSINYLFKDYFLEKKLSKEKIQIEEELDYIIQYNNVDQMKILMDKGLILPWKQFNKVLFENREFISLLEPDKYFNQFMPELKNLFINQIKEMSKTNFPQIMRFNKKTKRNTALDLCYLDEFLNKTTQWNQITFDKNEIKQLYENIFPIRKVKDKQMGYVNQPFNKDYYNSLIERLFKTINDKYSISQQENIEILGDRYNALNMESTDIIKHKVLEDIKYNNKLFKEENLAPSLRNTYNEIKILMIQLHKAKLEKLQELEFKNIVENQIPRIISEYVSIPEKYREKLKENEDNPDNLLKSSLSQIKNKLEKMIDDIQEENIKKMKVTHTYLKNSFGH